MKPYAYRRWKICYVAGRSIGWNPVWSALCALIAMRHIQIKITKGV